jgi:glutamyl-tRNA synthetase
VSQALHVAHSRKHAWHDVLTCSVCVFRQAYDSGDLEKVISEGNDAFKGWAKALGKEQTRKGKRLFMPLRIALTGSMQGPEVGEILHLLSLEDGDVADTSAYVPLPARMQMLRDFVASRS